MINTKVAIVTGGSAGIGRAICVALAQKGADIAVIYAGNEAAAQETVDLITALERRAIAYRCDVASFNACKQTVEQVIAELGSADILVNNAGITKDGLLLSMKEADFDRVLDVNLKGAFNMIKQVYGPMMRQRAGRIVNIASVAGLMGNAGQANYASAKAGLIGLTKTVAKELASRGVTCNAIAPGFIETDMTAKLSDKVVAAALEQIPQKRMGAPDDVAQLVAFLCGDTAAYITGEVIRVDGGMCM